MDDLLILPESPEDTADEPDLEPAFEPVMQFAGRLEIDPIPGGKHLQGSWLVLDDGTRYVLGYRPIPEYYPLIDKRVVVTGRPYSPGRDTQHVLADHLQVISVELASGETPYTEPPTEIPAPPLLFTEEAICARDGRWGQVVGRLVALVDDPDTYFFNAHIELEGGSVIVAHYAAEGLWRPYMGSIITVMSRIEVVVDEVMDADVKCGAVLTGWYALCPGVAERCGMEKESP